MAYKDSKVNRIFNGSDIRTQELEFSTLVGVTIQFNPDAQIVTLSLLLPSINRKGRSTSFTTFAIVTTKRTGFVGVQLGARETYRTISLEGTARLVEF